MSVQLQFGRHPGTGTGASNCCLLNGFWEATGVSDVMPIGGSFGNWRITFATAPGVGTSRTVTLQKNEVDTACTLTIAGPDTVGSYEGAAVSFAAGDRIRARITVSGAPANTVLYSAIEFTPATEGAMIFGFNGDSQLDPNEYMPIFGGGEQGWHNDFQHHSIVPCNGTVTAFRCINGVTPSAGNGLLYVLVKNGIDQDGSGGTPDTRLTIGDTETQDASAFTLNVTAGDSLAAKFSYTAASVGGAKAGTIVFTPTTQTNAICAMTGQSASNNGSTEFAFPVEQHSVWQTTPQEFSGGVTAVRFKTIIAAIANGALPAGDSWTFTLRKNNADTGLAVTIGEGADSGSFTLAGGVSIGPGDTFGLSAVAAGTPNSLSAVQRVALVASGTPQCSGGGQITVVPDPPDGETFTGISHGIRAWLRIGYEPDLRVDGPTISGLVTPTGRWSDRRRRPAWARDEGYDLYFRPGCFRKAIARGDSRLFVDHRDEFELASVAAGSLTVWESDRGLCFTATLSNSPIGQLTAYGIQTGLIRHCCPDVHVRVPAGRNTRGFVIEDVSELHIALLFSKAPHFRESSVRIRRMTGLALRPECGEGKPV